MILGGVLTFAGILVAISSRHAPSEAPGPTGWQFGALGLGALPGSLSPALILPMIWIVFEKRPAVTAWIGALMAGFGVRAVAVA